MALVTRAVAAVRPQRKADLPPIRSNLGYDVEHHTRNFPRRKVSTSLSACGRLHSVARKKYTIGRLEAETWEAFADLVERNNGIYGGCWSAPNHVEYRRGVTDPRTLKEQLVRSGQAHAAMVFDEEGNAQGWCQYGNSDSLDLKHLREYRKDPPPPAKWRIACIFVDRRHRGDGIARAALKGALSQIADAGGGRVEAISETTAGRAAQDRFLFSGTVELFEELGFARVRQVGMHAWIVNRTLGPKAQSTVGSKRSSSEAT